MKIRSMLAAACACLIASGSIWSFTTTLPAQADMFDLGDFDGNDSIDVDDAVSVLTFYAKAAAGVAVDDLSDEQFNAADIDTDGSITVQDAVYILTYYAQTSAGLEPSWADIVPEVPYVAPAWKPLIMTCCFLELFQTKVEMLLILLFILIKMIIQNYWWIPTLAVSCILIRMTRVVLWCIAGLLEEATDSVDTLKKRVISIHSVHRGLYQVL